MYDISMEQNYKQLTLAQLRSFCEVVRTGSISAAARALDLSHPTVWKQIHALEKQMGHALVETNRRGCQPTPAGQLLVEHALPLLEGIAQIQSGFHSTLDNTQVTLRLAASPRTLTEDLPDFLKHFKKEAPQIRIIACEIPDTAILETIANRQADMGLVPPSAWEQGQPAGISNEQLYELEPIILAPKGHAILKKKQIQFRDFGEEPLLNNLALFPNKLMAAKLAEASARVHSLRRFELNGANTIRQYVRRGFGMGLVGRLPNTDGSDAQVREISAAHLLGMLPVHVIYRSSATPNKARA
ncbi:MAG: LysR family transcriptional regulator, partial [Akkermansiaceae bacterium]|nr:LysR family transcriptional regulator [Verrucomicrobiales bacterium]